jgi:hypothetical protein
MKANAILEETWRIKDQIAREADYDIQKLCAQTRAWADANLGRVFKSGKEVKS